MSDKAGELHLLKEESERVRAARPGVRIQWSEDFRKRAGALVMGGVSSREVAGELGVSPSTVVEWGRRRGEGFAELKVVSSNGKPSLVTVATRRGHMLTITSVLARQWLQEGVL